MLDVSSSSKGSGKGSGDGESSEESSGETDVESCKAMALISLVQEFTGVEVIQMK